MSGNGNDDDEVKGDAALATNAGENPVTPHAATLAQAPALDTPAARTRTQTAAAALAAAAAAAAVVDAAAAGGEPSAVDLDVFV